MQFKLNSATREFIGTLPVEMRDRAEQLAVNVALQFHERDRARATDSMLQSKLFLKACEIADVVPSKRQASKYCNGYGAAWRVRREAALALGWGAGAIRAL